MIPKVKPVFDRKGKAGKKGEGEVEVYVYFNGSKRYLSTGIRVHKREWSDGVISMRCDAVELNKRLQWCMRTIQEQINAMVEADNVNIGALSLEARDGSESFLDWFETEINSRQMSRATHGTYDSVLNRLRLHGGIDSFSDVTLAKVEDFERWLCEQGVMASSRRLYHARINTCIKIAIKRGLIAINPYDQFVLPRNAGTRIKYLREDEREVLEHVRVPKRLERARDMFLFACYTGLRYSDIVRIDKRMSYKSGGALWLRGVTKKTSSEYNILLMPAAVVILDKYNWDMRIAYPTLREKLGKLCALCGLEHLTMHMGRHTFATWALSKGVRIEVVSKILTHSDIKTTQIYAKVLQKDVEAGFNLLSTGLDKK